MIKNFKEIESLVLIETLVSDNSNLFSILYKKNLKYLKSIHISNELTGFDDTNIGSNLEELNLNENNIASIDVQKFKTLQKEFTQKFPYLTLVF